MGSNTLGISSIFPLFMTAIQGRPCVTFVDFLELNALPIMVITNLLRAGNVEASKINFVAIVQKKSVYHDSVLREKNEQEVLKGNLILKER